MIITYLYSVDTTLTPAWWSPTFWDRLARLLSLVSLLGWLTRLDKGATLPRPAVSPASPRFSWQQDAWVQFSCVPQQFDSMPLMWYYLASLPLDYQEAWYRQRKTLKRQGTIDVRNNHQANPENGVLWAGFKQTTCTFSYSQYCPYMGHQ